MSEVTYVESDFLKLLSIHPYPYQQTASGYGSKLITQYKIKCADNKTRRVYAICYSNAASLYIIVKGEKQFLRDWHLDILKENLEAREAQNNGN